MNINVRKSNVWTFLLAMTLIFGIFGIIQSADAKSSYGNRYDTAHGNPSGTTSCTFCHGPNGPPLNSTGQTLLNSNFDYCSIGPATGQCAPTVTAPVISSFTANPTSITSGGSSTLSWSLSGGAPTTLTINGSSVSRKFPDRITRHDDDLYPYRFKQRRDSESVRDRDGDARRDCAGD